MDPFVASYLSSVAAEFTKSLATAAGWKIKNAIVGTPKERALEKAVEAGIIAMLADAKTSSQDEDNLLDDIFREFFQRSDVAGEMSSLLWGRSLDADALLGLFKNAGFQPDTLPGLDFGRALSAFQAAFLEQASEDPSLQEILQTRVLLEQLSTQQKLLEEVRKLLAFLKGVDPSRVAVTVGKIIAESIDGQRQVYEWIPVGVAPVDWEAHYLKTLISKCEPLDLSPIDESLAEYSQPVRVSDVFTTLNLEGVTRREDETVSEALERLLHPSGGRMAVDREEAERVPVQAVEAVAAVRRLVILGEPGGGKSTLTNYIVTQLARRRLGMKVPSEALPGWPEDESPLPVRIVLRRFAAWMKDDGKQGTAGDVWNYLEHMLNEWGCKEAFGHIKRTLIEEGGIVFFDGLDEVQETDEAAKRTKIISAIRDFVDPLDKVKAVVNCRNYAYERKKDPWHLPEDVFPVFKLAKFDEEQIESFVHAWYRAVKGIKGWDEEKASEEADDLFRRITAWKHLFELAQNPLLLTLMAQVHGAGHLPENRADLYDSAVDLLLARWENRLVRDEKGRSTWKPGVIARLGIRKDELRQRLEKVAFLAHERQETEKGRGERTADIPREDLRDELEDMLGSLDKAKEVLRYIQERAGLLVARDNRTYAFPHRSFQEYLAAMWIMRMGNFEEVLEERIQRDLIWWREVFLLAAGANRNTPRVVSDLLDALLPFPPGEDKQQLTEGRLLQALLAAQALLETDFKPRTGRLEATYSRIQDWLKASMIADDVLSPRRRAEAGDALAKLGDPRPGVGLDENGLPDIAWSELIEPGPFIMGNTKETDPMAWDDESPRFKCHLIKSPYKISKYPITVAQYRAFVENGGYEKREYWTEAGWGWKEESGVKGPRSYGEPFDLDNHPQVGVSWYEAVAFTRWLSEKLGKEVRLPTEAEWERAARHTDGRRYPWSPDKDAKPDPNRANYDATGIHSTNAVGIFPDGAAECGAEEMSGNVWEWCSTKWLGNYEEYEKRVDDDLEGDAARVLRGGSWDINRWFVRCASRHGDLSFNWYYYIGFRVVVSHRKTSGI